MLTVMFVGEDCWHRRIGEDGGERIPVTGFVARLVVVLAIDESEVRNLSAEVGDVRGSSFAYNEPGDTDRYRAFAFRVELRLFLRAERLDLQIGNAAVAGT